MSFEVITPATLYQVTFWTTISEYTEKRTVEVYMQGELSNGFDICDLKALLVGQGVIESTDKVSWTDLIVITENPENVVFLGSGVGLIL